jgi:ABC-type ATPase involved in cell division
VNISVRNECADYDTYRASRVKSLFNVESGANFSLDASLDIDDDDWGLGVIVGPSGSGKTSMGRQVLGEGAMYEGSWNAGSPIVDEIAPAGNFDAVTGALSAVGLGSVPTWLRPYAVLSNGEKFRADLARVISEAPDRVVVDEFTSVVDRQVAKFGALAFGKAWRRTGGKCVLLSCHYDILDWLEPDWIFDTATAKFARGSLRRRPAFELEIRQVDWKLWPLFEPHHYLKLPIMPAAHCYGGFVDDEPVCFMGIGTKNRGRRVEARGCRLVVMPEWQGAGVGMKFLNHVCQMQADGGGRLAGRRVTTIFHTSHPGLCSALRRDRRWRQLSAMLYGANKVKSARSYVSSHIANARSQAFNAGFGGHFRAVQGFRYYGPAGIEAAKK